MLSQEDVRLGLVLHYDGSGYFGWQAQKTERTVQVELESVVERLTGRPARVLAAGRTDRGVHATGQVVALDVPKRWSPEEFRRAANALLPSDLWIRSARLARPDFHPRYGALSRTYEYRVGQSEACFSPFVRPWCWPVRRHLDRAALDTCAAALVGEHSFRAFAKAGQPERGDRCTLRAAAWDTWQEQGLRFEITADRFLHHMVRYLVGTMVEIAAGRRPTEALEELLADADTRLRTSPPAPPQGLFLTAVEYADEAWADV